jgi:hypothetical protein
MPLSLYPVLFLLVATTASQQPERSVAKTKPQPTTTRVGKEAKLIPLDESQARTFHTVTAHPSVPALIEFPEPFAGAPSCGDCVDGSSPPEVLADSSALFLFDLFPEEQYLSIKPIQLPKSEGGSIPDEAYLTTLTVRLKSKLTITVRVQYAPAAKADARIVFTLPHREAESQFVREETKKQRDELEASFAERVNQGVSRGLQRTLLEPHGCTEMRRRDRSDDVILEVRELCRFGPRGYIRFTLENRHNLLYRLGEVQVLAGTGKDAVPVDALTPLVEGDVREMPFRNSIHAVVGFEMPPSASAFSYELVVTEDGGKNRRVALSGLGI